MSPDGQAEPVLRTTWRSDGLGGRIDEDGELIGFVRLVDNWYEPHDREARTAWVVEWMSEGIDIMQRSLIELDGEPANDSQRIEEISRKAAAVVELGPPDMPLAFGFSNTGFSTNEELRQLIELTSYALQDAQMRLSTAAATDDEYSAMRLNVAIVEAAGWMRALDELLTIVWQGHLTSQQREAVSQQADAYLASPSARRDLVAHARAARQADNKPYDDWTIALLSRFAYIPREELQGLRWLAGKLLHHGPLSVVELVHWRAGEQPRWKWRAADAIFPPSRPEQQKGQRKAYEEHLAGRDVLGSLNITTALLEVEFLFFPLLP